VLDAPRFDKALVAVAICTVTTTISAALIFADVDRTPRLLFAEFLIWSASALWLCRRWRQSLSPLLSFHHAATLLPDDRLLAVNMLACASVLLAVGIMFV
jgi:hypothetical protein